MASPIVISSFKSSAILIELQICAHDKEYRSLSTTKKTPIHKHYPEKPFTIAFNWNECNELSPSLNTNAYTQTKFHEFNVPTFWLSFCFPCNDAFYFYFLNQTEIVFSFFHSQYFPGNNSIQFRFCWYL